jgi:hypothetical protein
MNLVTAKAAAEHELLFNKPTSDLLTPYTDLSWTTQH